MASKALNEADATSDQRPLKIHKNTLLKLKSPGTWVKKDKESKDLLNILKLDTF